MRDDDLERALDDVGRETERRLVKHNELRPRHQRARNRQHLLLAARKRTGLLLAPFGQPRKLLEHAGHILRHSLPVLAQVAAHFEIFGDRHVGEDVTPFRAMRDPERQDLPGRGRA